jgi:hypothetical protein
VGDPERFRGRELRPGKDCFGETPEPTPETGVLPNLHTAPVMATMFKPLYRYVVVIYVAERVGLCIIPPGHAEILY